MKNFVKLVVISIFIFSFVIVCSFRSEASKASENEMNFSNSESSRNLYLNNCARCHGADGKSQTELGRLNDSPDISGGKSRRISNARLTRLITNGKGSMPGFGKKLNKVQISSIVRYVKGL